MKKTCVLTIAGSDSGAGAGIQSDLKTFQSHGIYGLTVITAITVQNTKGISNSFELPVSIILEQLQSIFDDFPVKHIKTGMLVSERVVSSTAEFLSNKRNICIVIDPVIYSKSRFVMLSRKGIKALLTKLLPICYLITPNLEEAELLSGVKISDRASLEKASEKIIAYGTKNILIKGGHFRNDFFLKKGTDILFDGSKYSLFRSETSPGNSLHGIGCTLSASIISNLAIGYDLISSVKNAKDYVNEKLHSPVKVGKGWKVAEV